jgi:hypothetical protein
VAGTGTGSSKMIMTSKDGIHWATRSSAADNSWFSVCYGDGLFVAVAFSGVGNRVMTCPASIGGGHYAETLLWEERDDFVYQIAKHPIRGIGDIYWLDEDTKIEKLITSIPTTYTGQSGDELSGYEGQAVFVMPYRSSAHPRFIAAFDGYQDDALGTYTGTPDALIERPDHVFKHLWAEILGADIGDLDSDTFDEAGVFYAANSYAFSLLIGEPIQAQELFMRLALQCRSRFLVMAYGTAKLLIRQLEQESEHAIPKIEIKRDSVSVTRSATGDLINLFHVYYDKDHAAGGNSPENYLSALKFQCGNSIAKYGQTEWQGDQTLFCFNAVTLDAMAEDVGNFLRQYHSTVRRIVRFGVFLDNLEVEPGDIIDLTHDLDAMTGFTCEVLKCVHHLGSKDRIDWLEIQAVENRWGE